MSADLEHYADKAMYEAAPMQRGEGGLVEPKVSLLWMTPDPLGAIAAACRMYEGHPTYSLDDVTDSERLKYLAEVQKTHLQAPLEFVKVHYFVEGVDRGFTHQAVRQRTAVFAQESLRFAVKHNMAQESVVPPSVYHGNVDVQAVWMETIEKIEASYNWMVANGVPAEDARGLLPHCVSTRLNFCTDLRNLIMHSGNRLCTQAQFHWRKVFLGFMQSIADYQPSHMSDDWYAEHGWQFEQLAHSGLFKPVCYQLGHCPFTASFDRGCTIRDRVQAFSAAGVPSNEWDQGIGLPTVHKSGVEIINPAEWMLDERAAWVR